MKVALLLFALTLPALAQSNTCGGLTSVTESAPPVYPALARLAHVVGQVIVLATFKTTGEVDNVEVISGPPMLLNATTNYVKNWHANQYAGPRTCTVVVRWEILNNAPKQPILRVDPQHVTVYSQEPEAYTMY